MKVNCPKCGTEMRVWEVVDGDEDRRTGEVYRECPLCGYEQGINEPYDDTLEILVREDMEKRKRKLGDGSQ